MGGVSMRMVDVIQRKKDGKKLSQEEIAFFIKGTTDGSIPDYQITALLMAICFCGMDGEETSILTQEMAHSGHVVDLSGIHGLVADKHSTGGVGDTTTLVLVPLVAACGGKVAKMSGRGLGHTGGTLDKLEAIPGFQVELGEDDLIRLVNAHGAAIVGQTGDLVPADKILYALRDVTATVESIPLIASSVMSKKLASGAQIIVLDVKAGSGAFMKNAEDAFSLARTMVDIGQKLGRQVAAIVTDMDQPLGNAIGNGLDVREAVEILSGKHQDSDLFRVCILLATQMLLMAGAAQNEKEAEKQLLSVLQSGAALDKLKEIIAAQGGDASVLDHPDVLCAAEQIIPVYAPVGGVVTHMDAAAIGRAAQLLGAGRAQAEDTIDHRVGILMKVRVGDRVEVHSPLAEFYVNDTGNFYEARKALIGAVSIGERAAKTPPLVFGLVTAEKEERYL